MITDNEYSVGLCNSISGFGASVIDLNELFNTKVSTTKFATATCNCVGDLIAVGDGVVIDTKAKAKHKNIVVALVEGEIIVCRLLINYNEIYLSQDNDLIKPKKITDLNELVIYGVVTHIIKQF